MTKNSLFLFSKTSHPDVTQIPILKTLFLQPTINFGDYDAIVFTSKQAVTALENISAKWRDVPALSIASKTEDMVKKAGGTLLDKGNGYGDSLDDIIVNKYASLRWLYPRPRVVASDFKERVKEHGINIDDVIVYETSCNRACSDIKLPDDAILIFTSPFTIECFLELYEFKRSYQVVVIGTTTAKALPEGVLYLMPETPNVEACVALAKRL
ncbi:MAG: uroporphyrinogen-III synthase [Helicobacteraceae bacterium]|jgi:uroporphyrinogen-III synthase|nr:uroporphyrinogen-III synthase [Helicobacteraceae bacterium]